MKILVASDIHGSITHLEKLYQLFLKEKPNLVIFLGDMFDASDEENIQLVKLYNSFYPTIFIRGNCDKYNTVINSGLEFKNTYSFTEFNKKIFSSHGHIYDKSIHPEEEFDVMLMGHTHIGDITKKDNKYFLNPGSLSLPKKDSVNSYMILEDEGISLKDLEGKTIKFSEW